MRTSCILVGLLAACLPDVEPPRWEVIDVEALDRALAMPTGEVTERTTQEVAARVSERKQMLDETTRFIRGVFAQTQEAGTMRALELPEPSGTIFYARASCPGPDPLQPDLGFQHGQMRIDSPDFTREFLDEYRLVGDLLLQLDDCRIASFESDGMIRAHYDPDAVQLALEPSFDAVDLREPGTTVMRVDEPMRVTGFETIEVLLTLESGETLVLEWITDTALLQLRGRNGSVTCTPRPRTRELDCLAPG